MTYDEPITSLPCHIRPHPLQKNAQTEARGGEELQVYCRPSEPCPEPAYLDLAALQHSETLAHYGHGALVKVAKGARRRITNDAAVNQLCCITALLHRHLGNPWQRFAILIEGCCIADDENLGVSGHGEVFLNAYPPRAIRLGVQPLACRRGSNARGPDNGFARNALARDHDTFGIDLIDAMSKQDFDALLREPLLRGVG